MLNNIFVDWPQSAEFCTLDFIDLVPFPSKNCKTSFKPKCGKNVPANNNCHLKVAVFAVGFSSAPNLKPYYKLLFSHKSQQNLI